MANEISINVNATLKNPSTGSSGFLGDSFAPGNSNYTQTTAGKFERVIATSTSDTAITLTGITTPGWCMLLNLDSTNSIDWGPTASAAIAPVGTLGPGGIAIFQCKSTVAIRVQASASTPKLQIKVWEV